MNSLPINPIQQSPPLTIVIFLLNITYHMNHNTPLLIATLLCIALTLPSTFDYRSQPSIIKFADYSLKQQGTCVAHAWGLQLAQTVSNAISLTMKSKFRLSSQHLIECVQGINEICHDATLDNIHKAIHYIQTEGITTTECIPNKPFSQPRTFCPRQCDDGFPFEYKLKANILKHETFTDTLNSLTSDQKTSAFVIVKVYPSMNYYSSQHPNVLENIDSENYEYRVGEIVGWKNKGKDVVVRLGLGDGWGYNGFANLNLEKHSKIIQEFYTVKFGQTSRIEVAKMQ